MSDDPLQRVRQPADAASACIARASSHWVLPVRRPQENAMIDDADWVSEVRQWYFSTHRPDALARANEVIDAATRPGRDAPSPRARTVPHAAPRTASSTAGSTAGPTAAPERSTSSAPRHTLARTVAR
jgi:hypothetical protein